MVFASPQKFFSFSRCLLLLFDYLKNGLTRKIRLISKFMMSQPVKKILAMHIMPSTLGSKGNQTMKFGQLIVYNTKNIFLQKSHKMWWRIFLQTPVLKNQEWTYLWIKSLKFYTVCSYSIPSWGLSKDIETKPQTTCF